MAKIWYDMVRGTLGYGHTAEVSVPMEQISESEEVASNLTDNPPSYVSVRFEAPPPAYESAIVMK